jgi:glyoxylase-like metal-dependent hydrolase (beta-lactamase superfamily II)
LTKAATIRLLEGVLRASTLAVALLFAGAAQSREPFHLIPGQVSANKGPDGNTIILDAPKGLIVIDTGRHPEHAQAILDYAKERGRPIAAIVNSHWHLDHTTGNWDIRQAYPRVAVYASNALEGALATFLKQGREEGDKMLADPKVPETVKAELARGRSVIDRPDRIRPNHVVTKSGRMTIAGRVLDVHLAKFAATEGDVWLYDPATRVAIVGDLVVDIVPFMDTACAEGWRKALGEIERAPFQRLIPGHGPVMNRDGFRAWKKAYENFVDCGHSTAAKQQCVDGWMKDDARFIDDAHRDYAREAADYYLSTRLRSSPVERNHYCKPLR